jgi:hypothetical protein
MMVNIQQKALTNNLVFNPQTVHCDFEAAAINAVRIELGVEPHGCLFYYTQTIFRHVQARAGSISIIFVDVDYRFFSIIFDDFDFGFDVNFFYNRDFDYFFAQLYLRFRGPRDVVI